MHNIEIEDFYHHDFTTASEWEVFVARLEEIIHEWKLPQTKIGPRLKPGDFVNLTWTQKSEELNFAGTNTATISRFIQVFDFSKMDSSYQLIFTNSFYTLVYSFVKNPGAHVYVSFRIHFPPQMLALL